MRISDWSSDVCSSDLPGTIPGESETQIFLRTSDQRPVSLSVLRRPGEAPKWSVSLDAMVHESSAPAGRDTLLWYRLDCFLPGQLPQSSVENASPAQAVAIRTDPSRQEARGVGNEWFSQCRPRWQPNN